MEYLSIVKIESRFLKYSTSRYSESRILLRIRVEGLEKGFLSFSTLFKKDGKIFHSSIMCTYYKCYLSNIYKILIDIKFILWIDQKLFTDRRGHVPPSFRNGFRLRVLGPIKSIDITPLFQRGVQLIILLMSINVFVPELLNWNYNFSPAENAASWKFIHGGAPPRSLNNGFNNVTITQPI